MNTSFGLKELLGGAVQLIGVGFRIRRSEGTMNALRELSTSSEIAAKVLEESETRGAEIRAKHRSAWGELGQRFADWVINRTNFSR